MIRCFRWAFPILLVSAHAAVAQALPEGMVMHRVAAGMLDSSGWTMADSTKGSFSVRLPLKFNDFMMRMPDKEKHVATMFGVGGTTVEGIKFVAQRLVYRKKYGASRFFSRIKDGTAFKTKPQKVNSHKYRGLPAIDLMLQDSHATGHMRYVLTEDSMIYLVVEVPEKYRSSVPEQVVGHFFDSLDFAPLDSSKVGASG